jgi:hypothetical protein
MPSFIGRLASSHNPLNERLVGVFFISEFDGGSRCNLQNFKKNSTETSPALTPTTIVWTNANTNKYTEIASAARWVSCCGRPHYNIYPPGVGKGCSKMNTARKRSNPCASTLRTNTCLESIESLPTDKHARVPTSERLPSLGSSQHMGSSQRPTNGPLSSYYRVPITWLPFRFLRKAADRLIAMFCW